MATRIYEETRGPGVLAQPPRQADQPLEIHPNGTRVLHALGLKSKLASVSLTPPFSLTRDAKTGYLLSQRPLGAFSEARYGAPACVVGVDALTTLLGAQCEEAGVTRDEDNAVEVTPRPATVTTTSGASHTHAAVVLATPPDSPLVATVARRPDPKVTRLP